MCVWHGGGTPVLTSLYCCWSGVPTCLVTVVLKIASLAREEPKKL